jgi:hypothetical protein
MDSSAVLEAAVVASGSAALRLSEIAPLRKSPPRFVGVDLPGHFLKHADEQTIVALEGVRRAVDQFGLDPREMADWGIVAAPRYIGRLAGANLLHRFPRVGTSAVAPHIVAQCSLHSVSGAASIALGIHGPNVGVGGGSWSVGDGLVAALTMFDPGAVNGVWLLLTQFDPEPLPDEQGQPLNAPTCYAAALALQWRVQSESMLSLRPEAPTSFAPENYSEPTVAEIACCIDAAQRGLRSRWACWLPGCGRAEMRLAAARPALKAAA